MQLVINGEPQKINPKLGIDSIYQIVNTLKNKHGYTSVETDTVISLIKGVNK